MLDIKFANSQLLLLDPLSLFEVLENTGFYFLNTEPSFVEIKSLREKIVCA